VKSKTDVLLDDFLEANKERTARLGARAADLDALSKSVELLHGKVDDLQASIDESEARDARIEQFYLELHEIASKMAMTTVAETRKMSQDLGGLIAKFQQENLSIYDTATMEIRKSKDYEGLRDELRQLLTQLQTAVPLRAMSDV